MNDSTPPSSRSAFRRLVVILLIVLGFVIYAYGWGVTDISLKETQDETRQSSVQRALRELLSPDIFDQDSTAESATTNFQKECTDQTLEQPSHGDDKPYIELSPDCAVRGDILTVKGSGFVPHSVGRIFLVRDSGQRQPFELARANDDGTGAFDIDSTGQFQVEIVIPNLRGESGALQTLEVEALVPVGLPYFSPTTNTVIEKMVETIFLALMATTIALPIAGVLSFLAARNLMKPVKIPLGNMLIGFALLPVGWVLGTAVLGPVGKLGVDWGKDVLMGIIGPAVAITAFSAISRTASGIKLDKTGSKIRGIVINVLLLAVVIFTLGAAGGIGVWIGTKLTTGILGYVGNFLGTLGNLVEISIVFLAGVTSAFYVSSVGTGLTTHLVRRMQGIASHVASGVLGTVCGGLLMAGTATLGGQAALLTVLAPLTAAMLGGPVLVLIYGWLVYRNRPDRGVVMSNAERTARLVLNAAGSVIAFVLTAHVLDVLHFVVSGRLPLTEFITTSTIIGAVLGGIGGLLAGANATFPVGSAIYNVTRTILNVLRSIEPLIMGIVFVIWVGIGPFAGVLALTLHSIASLGKLYSEQIENIDAGPIEALQSTGANRLQTIIYAVVPQIVPPYIAFTMYRWDINVRMSTIIGFVGGGGIGFLLQQQINLLRYRDAGVAVLAIAIVVSVLDYASASIRERMI